MKVALFGVGALGTVYGVRLALHGDVDLMCVVRPARVSSTEPLTIESVRKNEREAIAAPVRSDSVPGDADVILLAVGTQDLDAIGSPLGSSEAPIVVLTPMLPKSWARMRDAFGDRVHAAMPNVVAYTRKDDGVVRYWLAPAPTRIDEPRAQSPHAEAVRELARALGRAGLRGHLELGVHEKNPATTVCFIAIAMVLSLAGSAEALASDDALLALASRACREGVRLAHRVGTPEIWAGLSPTFAAPWSLRLGLGALRRVSPEALFYAEEHFGRKLRHQHSVMISEMIELAREKRLPHEAFDDLASRLSAHPRETRARGILADVLDGSAIRRR